MFALFSVLERVRYRGCLKKRFKDCIKVISNKLRRSRPEMGGTIAQDINARRQLVNSANVNRKM